MLSIKKDSDRSRRLQVIKGMKHNRGPKSIRNSSPRRKTKISTFGTVLADTV